MAALKPVGQELHRSLRGCWRLDECHGAQGGEGCRAEFLVEGAGDCRLAFLVEGLRLEQQCLDRLLLERDEDCLV